MRERPVIGFLTDFGLDGAAAICRGVMLSIAREAQIVDICHTVAKFAIADGAYLLRTAVPWLPTGVHVGVVDPGVGTDRRPIALLTARGDILVGPDNGLLLPAAERLGGIVDARLLENRSWMLPVTSTTFHGRDVFAPVAAHLALGAPFAEAGEAIEAAGLVRLDMSATAVRAGQLDTAVVYIDSFGNVRLAAGAGDLVAAFGGTTAAPELVLELEPGPGRAAPLASALEWRRTFGEAAPGSLLLYVDSAGDAAIAVSNGDAARTLGVTSGANIRIRRA